MARQREASRRELQWYVGRAWPGSEKLLVENYSYDRLDRQPPTPDSRSPANAERLDDRCGLIFEAAISGWRTSWQRLVDYHSMSVRTGNNHLALTVGLVSRWQPYYQTTN